MLTAKKCIIWGTGGVFLQNITSVKYHENNGAIEIVCITSNECIYDSYYGYQWLPKQKALKLDYDVVLVAAEEYLFGGIVSEAKEYGIESHRIFKIDILRKLELDLDANLQLQKSPPSILANNCWGGLTYNSLGLRFSSPLINMFESDEDYLKLLEKPEYYFSLPFEFDRCQYDEVTRREYPVCRIGDVSLNCNHYRDYSEAKAKWESRVKRIDYENLFVMMSTTEKEIAKRFSELDYEKKICFVPFKDEIDDCVQYVAIVDNPRLRDVPFWRIIMGMANGAFPYYDVFELIQTGKVADKE